jgi:hypothetical protein
MPTWNDKPPKEPIERQYRLIRVPASKPLALVILAEKLTGCPTHYWHGRTAPCERPECEACEQGNSPRWHAYVPCIIAQTGERCILELTGQAAQQLSPTIDEYQTLRGIKIVVERKSKRPNGRIAITTIPGRVAESSIPAEPDVITTMTHIWGLDEGEGLKIAKDLEKATKPFEGNGQRPRFQTNQEERQ